VLQKALSLGLPAITAINKIDRKDARPEEVLEEVYSLFIDLGADDKDIEFPVLFTDGRSGVAQRELGDSSRDLRPLFETILEAVPAPEDTRNKPLQLHVNNIGWDDYVGRLIIGRLRAGTLAVGQEVLVAREGCDPVPAKVMRLYGFEGLQRVEISSAGAGQIVAVAGVEDVSIGDTVVDGRETPALPSIEVDEPTLAMNFCVNNSPFAGQEGKYVTSRKLRERLFRETLGNVAIRVEDTDSPDVFKVVGRGELQLGIFVETMRREGYELMLSRPQVVTREVGGKLMEPRERLYVDCPGEMMGAVTEKLGPRRGRLIEMTPMGERVRLVYEIPTRGLIGFNGEFLTETRGQGILHTSFDGWIPWQGPLRALRSGVLVADRQGVSTPYALFNL
jgi:GTP-binding protein